MTLSFPLTVAQLADLLPIVQVTWIPRWQQEGSNLGAGETVSKDLGPRLWEADIALKSLGAIEVRALKARIEALDGMLNTFYLYDPLSAYPTNDPTGAILGASTVTVKSVGVDNKSLALQGLPVGYQLSNDMLALDYLSPARRALLRMDGTATADVAGETAEFEVRPHLRPGIAAGDAVYLVKPAAKVKLVKDGLTYEPANGNRTRIRLRARQTLQAG